MLLGEKEEQFLENRRVIIVDVDRILVSMRTVPPTPGVLIARGIIENVSDNLKYTEEIKYHGDDAGVYDVSFR